MPYITQCITENSIVTWYITTLKFSYSINVELDRLTLDGTPALQSLTHARKDSRQVVKHSCKKI